MVPIVNCGTSFYVGFVELSVVSFMALINDIPHFSLAEML